MAARDDRGIISQRIKKKMASVSSTTGPRNTPQGKAKMAARITKRTNDRAAIRPRTDVDLVNGRPQQPNFAAMAEKIKANRQMQGGGSGPFNPGGGSPNTQGGSGPFNPDGGSPNTAPSVTSTRPQTMPPVPQGDPAEYTGPSLVPRQKPPMTRDWLPLPGDPQAGGGGQMPPTRQGGATFDELMAGENPGAFGTMSAQPIQGGFADPAEMKRRAALFGGPGAMAPGMAPWVQAGTNFLPR